jgi:hypothetical protein
VEVDLATESLPTLRRKLLSYLDVVERGQLGPANLVPRVLVSCISPARTEAVRSVIARLPEPATDLFVALLDREATVFMLASLHT